MNKQTNPGVSIDSFRIWDYPIFALFLGYVWLEFVNPILASSLQIIPRIPNSAIALGICYATRPDFIKKVRGPFNPVEWALPFLFLITINVPFVQYARDRVIVDVISTWFWLVFLLPLMIRVLATSSGRWHFVLFNSIGLVLLAWQYYVALVSNQFQFGDILISRNHLSVSVIAVFPLLLGYAFQKNGLKKYYLIFCLIVVVIASVPAGSRALWLISLIELILLGLYVIPRKRTVANGIVIAVVLFAFLSFWDVSNLYSSEALEHFETRIRKAQEWQDDTTVWKRIGMVVKAKMILEEHPLLGVGYSGMSFALFNAGNVYVFGHLAAVRRAGAHNTYLFFLGGTGILGFLAFLYYLRKVWIILRSIPASILKSLDFGPFLVSTTGIFLNYLFTTKTFTDIAYSTAIIFAVFIHQYNLQTNNTDLLQE